MDKKEFFAWCAERGLARSQDISAAFRVSSQTIRNWDRKPDSSPMPAWVPLACAAIDGLAAGTVSAAELAPMTVTRLSKWQSRHRFRTYDDTAAVFSIKRQAVHNWYKRQSLPRWLSLACAGYDIGIQSRTLKDSDGGA